MCQVIYYLTYQVIYYLMSQVIYYLMCEVIYYLMCQVIYYLTHQVIYYLMSQVIYYFMWQPPHHTFCVTRRLPPLCISIHRYTEGRGLLQSSRRNISCNDHKWLYNRRNSSTLSPNCRRFAAQQKQLSDSSVIKLSNSYTMISPSDNL